MRAGAPVVVVVLVAAVVTVAAQSAPAAPVGATANPPGWSFEVLDVGGTTGAPRTVAYGGRPHVFAAASGGGVRHLWFDGSWKAETLDPSESDGDIAVAVQGDELWVFARQAGANAVRVLQYRQWRWTASTWEPEPNRPMEHLAATAWRGQVHLFGHDERFFGLRHGWFGDGPGVESLDVIPRVPVRGIDAMTYATNGDLQVFSSYVSPNFPVFGAQLRHGWYDGSWHFEAQPGAVDVSDSGSVAATELGTQLQVFADTTGAGVGHMWFDRADGSWRSEHLDGAGGTGEALSATVFAGNGQIQVFGAAASPGAVRHGWFDGVWHFEDLAGDVDVELAGDRTAALDHAGQLHAFAPTVGDGLLHLWYTP